MGSSPAGTVSGDYLYWNATTSAWTVGSETVNFGAGSAAISGTVAIGKEAQAQGLYGVAVGQSAVSGLYSIAVGHNGKLSFPFFPL